MLNVYGYSTRQCEELLYAICDDGSSRNHKRYTRDGRTADTASMLPFSMLDRNIKTFYEHNTKAAHNAASNEASVFG